MGIIKVEADKVMSGGGDGITTDLVNKKLEKTGPRRCLTPSARKFHARHPPGTPRTEENRTKLRAAIEELSKPKMNVFERLAVPKSLPNSAMKTKCDIAKLRNVSLRKKSLSVAEMNPSRRRGVQNFAFARGVSPATPAGRLQERRLSTSSDVGTTRDLAGRRVYQQLLLNAWRRRRQDVATLVESCTRLSQQVSQLEIQVDVLQKLRESESQRRSEVSALNGSLEGQIATLEKENGLEKQRHEDTKARLEEVRENLQTSREEFENLSNELKVCQQEAKSYEKQLHKERKKLNEVKGQREEAYKKINEYSKEINQQNIALLDYEKKLGDTRKELELSNLRNEEINIEADNLEKELKYQEICKKDLEKQLEIEVSKVEKAKGKNSELKHLISTLKMSKRKLMTENTELRGKIEKMEKDIEERNSIPWWVSAGSFIASSLKNSAFLMLPALPKEFNLRCTVCSNERAYIKYF